jgi:hypothetical protein
VTTTNRSRDILAFLLSFTGLVLLWSICLSVHYNIWWLSRTVFLEVRLTVYLWTGVAVALLFVVRGIVMAWSLAMTRLSSLEYAESLFTIGVGSALGVIAFGWRIRTDVGPTEAIQRLSDLPMTVRVLADPLLSYSFIGAIAFVAFLCFRYRPREN